MESQKKKSGKKFWKPPSFEDFNLSTPNKKIKLDSVESDENSPDIPNIVVEPKSVEDLAMHPKKVEEVRNWMKWSKDEKAPILLVTGPAGCGKTTTIKVSAKAEDILVKEWINPIDKIVFSAESELENGPYDKFSYSEVKQTDKFEDFVFKSSRYNSLFEEAISTLILVEDIPNIFIWKPKLFHEFLDKYKLLGKSPIVFVITNDNNLNLNNDLFPNHIKVKFSITNIKFNPVNNSSLIKNLKSLVDSYGVESTSPLVLENICKNSNGDLRTAVNNLLLFLRSNPQSFNFLPKKVKKKSDKNNKLLEANNLLSSKDCNFDFYHILGRILYPKKMSETERRECENPNRLFTHDVQSIAEQLKNTHLSILHENYLQTFGKFKDVVGGAECFSVCDVLSQHQGLEEYTSLIAVISLMYKNTEPRKNGFNPIKKSNYLNSNKLSIDAETEFFNHQLSKREALLDFVPFFKIIKQNKNFENKFVTPSLPSEKEQDSEPEDVFEIEEYDD